MGDAEHRLQAHPACHSCTRRSPTSAAEATTAGVDVDEIEEIVAFAPADVVPIVLEPLADKHAPRSEYDAKFEPAVLRGEYLVHGKVDVYDDVGPTPTRDPRVLDLTQRVRYENSKDFPTFGKAFPGSRLPGSYSVQMLRARRRRPEGAEGRGNLSKSTRWLVCHMPGGHQQESAIQER